LSLSPELRDLVRELDRAERSGMPYVVLTWFRDTCLTSTRLPWAGRKDDPVAKITRQRVLSTAIEQGLVATSRVVNPKDPSQSPTTVSLTRSHPGVADALTRAEQLPEFRPAPIRGEPASETILRERR
jgi:hypothetical protein